MAQATVTAIAKIDVSPSGISISFEGIDSDLASLMARGKNFTCTEPVYRAYDTSDIVVKTRQSLQFVEPVEIESTVEDIPPEIQTPVVTPPREG